MAIDAVTLVLFYFDIFVAGFVFIQLGLFPLFWFHRTLLFGVFATLLLYFARAHSRANKCPVSHTTVAKHKEITKTIK